jgi:polyisoprenoid-binding protein YceI
MIALKSLAAAGLAVIVVAAPIQGPGRKMDAAHSSLTVHVYKSGLFAFAADNHIINAPLASGVVDEASKTVELSVNAADLKVLDPSMPAGRRAEVQAKMVSPDVLDVGKYPKIAFKSTALTFDGAGKANVVGDLTLHGQTQRVTVHVTRVSVGHYKGSATVRQSDFGIKPIRIAGGTVKVKNDVDIDFVIVTR